MAEYVLTIHNDKAPPNSTEHFEANPAQITTESVQNGERIAVHDDKPDNLLLEAFVPSGTAYTLRRKD
ncbi:hypothetical protein [Natrinema pallidum]|uniref:hypothetical protein n=1 Tax=Natrinema pallidum TaxID=69527 RepID=UPI003752084A